MLAAKDSIYCLYWLRWARRLLLKCVAIAPLSNRRLLIIQLDMIDRALDVIEDARAQVLGREIPNRHVRHPVVIRLKDGRVI
jgi:hypothetical protein